MNTVRWILIAWAFAVPFYIPGYIPSEESQRQALAVGFTEEQIEVGRQYSLQRRALALVGTYLHIAILVILVVHSRRVADGCLRVCRGWWLPAVLVMGLCLLLLDEIIDLPLGIVRHEHLRQWGLTQQGLGDWLQQHFLALAVFGGLEALILAGFYLLVRYFPRTWWLWSAVGTTFVAIAGAFLLPVFFAPLFNTFQPLSETKWKHLEPMVQKLLARGGVSVEDVLVVDASRQSGHTNAYFTGFGSTRRIVLYDTLLEKNSPAEIESILAHEIGHWMNHHIVKGIIIGSVSALLGLYVLYRLINWLVGRAPWFLRNAADPAGLPVIVLIGFFGSWLVAPIENGISRSFERQADAVSLELGGGADVFISAEKKLALDNKSNLTPNPISVFLFSTHPTAVQRIQTALAWKGQH